MKVRVNNKEYDVEVARTEEEKEVGLSNIEYLPDDEGMLFVYDTPQEVGFWMKDTLIPLDIVFINDEEEVISVHQGIPNDETPIIEDDVLYVLEVPAGSGIKTGDEIEFEDEENSKPLNNKMLVLNENGEVQMELEGGERIFSRKNTKVLIKFALKADKTKQDKDYKNLGKKIFKFLDIQESNNPEYVELKDK